RHGDLARLGKRQASFRPELPYPLQPEKGRVSFVRVAQRGPETGEIEPAHAANPKGELLTNPHLLVPSVQAVRDLAVARPVDGQMRDEEEKRGAPHAHATNEEMDIPLA